MHGGGPGMHGGGGCGMWGGDADWMVEVGGVAVAVGEGPRSHTWGSTVQIAYV